MAGDAWSAIGTLGPPPLHSEAREKKEVTTVLSHKGREEVRQIEIEGRKSEPGPGRDMQGLELKGRTCGGLRCVTCGLRWGCQDSGEVGKVKPQGPFGE